MKVTDGEKVILLMLSRIYKELKITDSLDPEFIENAILEDALWAIPLEFSGISFEDSKHPEVVENVFSILGMWSVIESSFNNLKEEEKAYLSKRLGFSSDHAAKFFGFDGNNESEYLSAASFLINKCNRYTEFQGRYLNHHAPTLDIYKRMLPVYEEMLNEHMIGEGLSVDDLANLLTEIIHPSMR